VEDSKQQDGKSKADRAWDNIVEAFSPIASLFTMRTVFLVALLAGIGFWIGRRDIKLFALSADCTPSPPPPAPHFSLLCGCGR
jgi:hypothetical protein